MEVSIEDAVRRILDEIQQLKSERAAISSVNPMTASLVQCEIFRKFAVIDLLISSLPLWRSWRLQRKVSLAKREAKAEASDLELMSVPVSGRRRKTPQEWMSNEDLEDKHADYFPLFMDFVPEIRGEILGKIVSATDKLAVMKGIPGTGELMNWDITSLKFELILPMLLERRLLEWTDVMNLSKVNAYFRDFMTTQFEDSLKVDGRSHWPYAFKSQQDILKMCRDDPPSSPTFDSPILFFDSFLGQESQDNLQSLRQTGKKIRDVEIRLMGMSTLQGLHIICQCLEMMPNVRRVQITAYEGLSSTLQEDEQIDAILLPDLHYIETLDFVALWDPIKIEEKLLKKYGNALWTLTTTTFSPIVNLEMNLNRVIRLTISSIVMHEGVFRDCLRLLEALAGVPLKYIGLYFESEDRFHVPDLMAVLSRFGETLEDLSVGILSDDSRSYRKASWDPAVVASLYFPKLKRFTLKYRSEGEWSFLLHCPALEELILRNSGPPKARRFYERVDIFDLGWSRKKMYLSTIWKLLPSLQTIQFYKHFRGLGEKRVRVTREKCIAFQLKVVKDKSPLATTTF